MGSLMWVGALSGLVVWLGTLAVIVEVAAGRSP